MAMFIGDDKNHSLKNRVVYQVVGKELAPHSSYSHHTYRYRIAFDIQNPLGTSVDDSVVSLGTRAMRKLSLVDVAALRMRLDTFLQEWARSVTRDDSA